jgi:hypothetical protein
MNLSGPQQNFQQRIDPKSLQDISCDKCDHKYFIQVHRLLGVSKLASPTGEEGMMPVPTYACHMCGHVNEELRPQVGNEDA